MTNVENTLARVKLNKAYADLISLAYKTDCKYTVRRLEQLRAFQSQLLDKHYKENKTSRVSNIRDKSMV